MPGRILPLPPQRPAATKTCSKCKRILPLSEFYRCRAKRDGHYYYCKDCSRGVGRMQAHVHARDRNDWRKRWRVEHPEKTAAYTKKQQERFPEKFRARKVRKDATRRGKLKKEPCVYPGCGNPKVEAHHPDYSKPLDVVWLCRHHHRMVEGQISELRQPTIHGHRGAEHAHNPAPQPVSRN